MQTKPKTFFNFKNAALVFNKKTEFNILVFVLLYIVLLQGFYLYVGITSPGGTLYASFLQQYANFPQWITIVITKTSLLLLKLAGYTAYQRNLTNITLAGGGGVNIAWGCLGVGAMSLWTAFVVAHRAALKYKLKWIALGIFLICVVNIARVITIILSIHYKWQYPMHFDAHQTFNILSYAVILLFMYIFTRSYNQ